MQPVAVTKAFVIAMLLATILRSGRTQEVNPHERLLREAATLELGRLPNVPVEALQRAMRGDDPEVVWSAEMVLHDAGSRSTQVLDAVLWPIHHEQLRGLASRLLNAVPLCQEAHLRRIAQQTLVTTSEHDDVALLRKALDEGDPQMRPVGVAALGAVLANWFSSHCVVEFDATGQEEIWSRDGFFSPDSAQRLSNSNTTDRQAAGVSPRIGYPAADTDRSLVLFESQRSMLDPADEAQRNATLGCRPRVALSRPGATHPSSSLNPP